MVRYGATAIDSAKSARSRGSYLRVSFKNTRETAQAINGWKQERALRFLENVKEHKEAVPMRRYAGSTGRTAQGKQFGVSKARDGQSSLPNFSSISSRTPSQTQIAKDWILRI